MIKCFRDLLPDVLIGIVYSYVGQVDQYEILKSQYKQKLLLTYGRYNGRGRSRTMDGYYPMYLLLNDEGKIYRKFKKNMEQYADKIWYNNWSIKNGIPHHFLLNKYDIPYHFLLNKNEEIKDILKNKRIFNLID